MKRLFPLLLLPILLSPIAPLAWYLIGLKRLDK
jgi:hypothetical protein